VEIQSLTVGKILLIKFHSLIHNEIHRFLTDTDLWKYFINVIKSIYYPVNTPVKKNWNNSTAG